MCVRKIARRARRSEGVAAGEPGVAIEVDLESWGEWPSWYVYANQIGRASCRLVCCFLKVCFVDKIWRQSWDRKVAFVRWDSFLARA